MFASVLLLIPILICGSLGAAVGYVFRYRLQLRRFLTVIAAVLVFVGLEITSGPCPASTASAKT
jgi:hypothetical protein